MTEAEWLVCEDLVAMLGFVKDTTSDRKQRLVSCGYSRLVWHLLCDIGREAIETAERYAEGEVTDALATKVQEQIQRLLPGDSNASPYSPVVWALMGNRGSSYPPWYAASLAALNVQELLGIA